LSQSQGVCTLLPSFDLTGALADSPLEGAWYLGATAAPRPPRPPLRYGPNRGESINSRPEGDCLRGERACPARANRNPHRGEVAPGSSANVQGDGADLNPPIAGTPLRENPPLLGGTGAVARTIRTPYRSQPIAEIVDAREEESA
jgi:hypothetical protein